MKKLIYISIGSLLMFISCSKNRLDLNNPNQVTTDNYWKTEADVLAGLAATYNSLPSTPQSGPYSVRGTELRNIRGDDFYNRNDVNDLYTMTTYTNTPSNGAAASVWNTCYQGILSANQVIEYAPNATMDETLKAQDIAEAKFLRGLFYFHLVTNFLNVPLRLSVPQSQADYYIAKSPADSVWMQIVSDFTSAASVLPSSYTSTNLGRATSGAAYGYLGKAYLYQGKYAEAQAALENIMNGEYSLMPNFEDNFGTTYENNVESVFEIQVSDVGGTGMWDNGANQNLGLTIGQEFAPSEVGGWFEACPTDTLLTEFLKESQPSGNYDTRLPATLIWKGETTARGGSSTFYQLPIATFFNPGDYTYSVRIKKYQNYTQANELTGTNGTSYSSSINERALRYADILLMHAEVVTMQGNPSAAYSDVNAIRNRAGLINLTAGYTQTEMMKEIKHQRMLEFVREGSRFYDLVRWGDAATVISSSSKPGAQYYTSKFNYLPIPQTELDNNPLMVQNTGW